MCTLYIILKLYAQNVLFYEIFNHKNHRIICNYWEAIDVAYRDNESYIFITLNIRLEYCESAIPKITHSGLIRYINKWNTDYLST